VIFMRRMRPQDVASVRALFSGAGAPCPEPEACVFSFVFEDAGKILGAALGRAAGDEGELCAFFVDPARAGEGLEAGLILCVLDLMDRHGVACCRCDITEKTARPHLLSAGFAGGAGSMSAPTRHACSGHADNR